MKNSLSILGGTCTDKYLYLIYRRNSMLQIEKKTGIVTDIIELKNAGNHFMEYLYIFCHSEKIFMCPFRGDRLAVYDHGDVFYYDFGLGENVQIVAVTLVQDGFVMLSQKVEGFLSFNIKTNKINVIKTEHEFYGDPVANKMNDIFWMIDRKGQVIENNRGEIRVLYQGDQKLKKYHRDNRGEYFIYLNGEVWKRSGNETKKLAMLPDMPDANIGCYCMDGVLYIVYLERNLIYVISEKQFYRWTEDDCHYWEDEDGVVNLPTIMPDEYHGGIYIYTNYQHKIIYLGLHGEIVEKPVYVRKQKPDILMREIRSDDLQSYYEESLNSKDIEGGTLEDWIKKI